VEDFYLQPYNQVTLTPNEKRWGSGREGGKEGGKEGESYISKKILTNTEEGKRQLLGMLSPNSSSEIALLVLLISGWNWIPWTPEIMPFQNCFLSHLSIPIRL
jgi:hypothetical protein